VTDVRGAGAEHQLTYDSPCRVFRRNRSLISTRVTVDGGTDVTTRVVGGKSELNCRRSQSELSSIYPRRSLPMRTTSPEDFSSGSQLEIHGQCYDADWTERRNGDCLAPTVSYRYNTHLSGRQAVFARRSGVDEMKPTASMGLLRRSRSVGPSLSIRTPSADCCDRDGKTCLEQRPGYRKKLVRAMSVAERPHWPVFGDRQLRQQERLDSIQIIDRAAPVGVLQVRKEYREQFNSVVTMEKNRAPEITSEHVKRSRGTLQSQSGVRYQITDRETTHVDMCDSLPDSSAAIVHRQRPVSFVETVNVNATGPVLTEGPPESENCSYWSGDSRQHEMNFQTIHLVVAGRRTTHETLAALFIARLKEKQRFNFRPSVDEEPGSAGPSNTGPSFRGLPTEIDLDRLERVLLPTADRYRTPVYYASIVYGGNRSLMVELESNDDAVNDDMNVTDLDSIAALQVSNCYASSNYYMYILQASLHRIIR
jgi:hypothetical protein